MMNRIVTVFTQRHNEKSSVSSIASVVVVQLCRSAAVVARQLRRAWNYAHAHRPRNHLICETPVRAKNASSLFVYAATGLALLALVIAALKCNHPTSQLDFSADSPDYVFPLGTVGIGDLAVFAPAIPTVPSVGMFAEVTDRKCPVALSTVFLCDRVWNQLLDDWLAGCVSALNTLAMPVVLAALEDVEACQWQDALALGALLRYDGVNHDVSLVDVMAKARVGCYKHLFWPAFCPYLTSNLHFVKHNLAEICP